MAGKNSFSLTKKTGPLIFVVVLLLTFFSFLAPFVLKPESFARLKKLTDILGDILTVLLCFALILIAINLKHKKKVFSFLSAGFSVLYIANLQNLLEEFKAAPGGLDLFRNLGTPLGLLFIGLGLYFWVKDHQDILKDSIDLQEKSRMTAVIDSLTGLYNVRHLFDQLERELVRAERYGEKFCLLMIDIDNFKEFNNRFSHLEGDHVLDTFGSLLRKILRVIDSAYRYGGEKFVVLLPETDIPGAVNVAERILINFRNHTFHPGQESQVNLTVSVGIISWKGKAQPVSLLKKLEAALLDAKKNGRNQLYIRE